MPRASRRSKTVTASVAVTVPRPPAASSAAPRPKRKSPRQRQPRADESALARFKRSALNPFMYAPPALGYEMFTTPHSDTLWNRVIGYADPSSAATNAAVIFDPVSVTTAAVGFGSGNPAFVSIITSNSLNTPLNTMTNLNLQTADSSTYLTRNEAHRPVTAAVRVTVRYPMTSAPGRLIGFNVADRCSVLASMSMQQLLALDLDRNLPYDSSGIAQHQVNWRQAVAADLAMQPVNALPGTYVGFTRSYSVILAVGWAPGFTIDVDAISHTETNVGLQAGGSLDSAEQNTVAITTSMERLGAEIRRLPAVLDSASLKMCQAVQLREAMSRHSSRKSGVRGSGGSASSASAAAAAPHGSAFGAEAEEASYFSVPPLGNALHAGLQFAAAGMAVRNALQQMN